MAQTDEKMILSEILRVINWSEFVRVSIGFSFISQNKNGEYKFCHSSKSQANTHQFRSRKEALDWISQYERPNYQSELLNHGVFEQSDLKFISAVATHIWIDK